MTNPSPIFRLNDHILTLDELKDVDTDTFINDATVQVTLKEEVNQEPGDDISGQAWPLTMVYEVASNGKYEATLSDTLIVVPGTFYVAIITVVKGLLNAQWEFQVQGSRRRN